MLIRTGVSISRIHGVLDNVYYLSSVVFKSRLEVERIPNVNPCSVWTRVNIKFITRVSVHLILDSKIWTEFSNTGTRVQTLASLNSTSRFYILRYWYGSMSEKIKVRKYYQLYRNFHGINFIRGTTKLTIYKFPFGSWSPIKMSHKQNKFNFKTG